MQGVIGGGCCSSEVAVLLGRLSSVVVALSDFLGLGTGTGRTVS